MALLRYVSKFDAFLSLDYAPALHPVAIQGKEGIKFFHLATLKVDGSYLCPECNFPLCGEMCAYGGEHADRECKVFSGVEPKIEIKDFTKGEREAFS